MDLEHVLNEDTIFEKCLENQQYLAEFLITYKEYVKKIDWHYFLIMILESYSSWNDFNIYCIKMNLQSFYKAVSKKQIELCFADLKEMHLFVQNARGRKYYKPLLEHFPEIKGYAFKLYRKNIIGF